jgi:hypothetical protein
MCIVARMAILRRIYGKCDDSGCKEDHRHGGDSDNKKCGS